MLDEPVPAAVMYVFVYVRDLPRSRVFYERVLGLPVLEEDETSVKYDTGGVILALNRAADWGLEVGDGQGSSLLVFHVDDIDRARSAAESRGASFDETLRYGIGATTACYDPDGHCITLYEPSPAALTWPSAARYRALTGGRRDPSRLGPFVYLFHFARDPARCKSFYEKSLGLSVLEYDSDENVTKYDGGTMILALHPLEDYPASLTGIDRPQSISVVFRVPDIAAAVRLLTARGVGRSLPVVNAEIGRTALFLDPEGHLFYLYEPSPEALHWPSAAKAASLGTALGAPESAPAP